MLQQMAEERVPGGGELLVFAHALADAGREILLPAASRLPQVEIKADLSPVTETDLAIEARLREMIAQRYPGHGILGEEYGAEGTNAAFVWVLDPIDGTAPFIAGLPVYGTLIGLAHEGRPLIGIIDHPATDDRWAGVAGRGAALNGAAIATRACGGLETAFMTNSNPDFLNPEERSSFDRLRQRVRYTQYGGSCYAYGLLASGRTDLALDSGMEIFDILAPAAVIEGAGGRVTDWQGRPIHLGWQGAVVAAGDSALHDTALAVLGAPGAGH
jgi:histidinol phosphatase-like enzyme (inositol monophosphatase family)